MAKRKKKKKAPKGFHYMPDGSLMKDSDHKKRKKKKWVGTQLRQRFQSLLGNKNLVDEKMQKEKRKNVKINVDSKSYFLHSITWQDLVGDSGISSVEEFNKMKCATIVTIAFIYKKDKNYLYTFASYSNDGYFGDRNIIPLGVIKKIEKIVL